MLSVLMSTAAMGFVMPPATNPAMLAAQPRAASSMMSGAVPTKKVWTTFAKTSECQPGTVISGFQYGQEIAIATEKGGAQYAVSNKLPPTGQPATFGELKGGGIIVEPVSQTSFSMKTGKPVGTWCPSPVGQLILRRLVSPANVPVFPVRKSGNNVQVLINVNAKLQFESSYWRGVLDAQGKVDGGYY